MRQQHSSTRQQLRFWNQGDQYLMAKKGLIAWPVLLKMSQTEPHWCRLLLEEDCYSSGQQIPYGCSTWKTITIVTKAHRTFRHRFLSIPSPLYPHFFKIYAVFLYIYLTAILPTRLSFDAFCWTLRINSSVASTNNKYTSNIIVFEETAS
jgi:hypothetical protein